MTTTTIRATKTTRGNRTNDFNWISAKTLQQKRLANTYLWIQTEFTQKQENSQWFHVRVSISFPPSTYPPRLRFVTHTYHLKAITGFVKMWTDLLGIMLSNRWQIHSQWSLEKSSWNSKFVSYIKCVYLFFLSINCNLITYPITLSVLWVYELKIENIPTRDLK